jgi:SAM-dependent methyltransferase
VSSSGYELDVLVRTCRSFRDSSPELEWGWKRPRYDALPLTRGPPTTTIDELDARFYPGYVDVHERFDHLVRRYLPPGGRVLDAGAGGGERYPYELPAAGLIIGADVSPAIARNANLDGAVLAELGALPFGEDTFDLVISKYVFEHLSEPLASLREVRRVMRRGGHLVIHTPNRFHYFAIAARLTPHGFHEWFNHKRGVEHEDVFPTVYRANDLGTLRRLAMSSRFAVEELISIETKPDYLFFNPLAYRAGIAYERLVNRYERFRYLRCALLGVFRAV